MLYFIIFKITYNLINNYNKKVSEILKTKIYT